MNAAILQGIFRFYYVLYKKFATKAKKEIK